MQNFSVKNNLYETDIKVQGFIIDIFLVFFSVKKKTTDLFILAEFFQTLAELFNIIVFFLQKKRQGTFKTKKCRKYYSLSKCLYRLVFMKNRNIIEKSDGKENTGFFPI